MVTEAKKISQFAKTFIIASNRCQEQRPLGNGSFEMPLIPGVVCMAFSVELNFKSIIKAQGKDARGHKLDDLYKKISDPERSLIFNKLGLSKEQFELKISEIGNAFIDFRYVYEHDSIALDIDFLRKLSFVVQDISMELTS